MKAELLAPANLNTFRTAVQAGADAIYLGGSSFGARKFADNFDLSQMEQAVDYCHLRGVKVYLTSNILIGNGEALKFLSFIKDAYNLGIDAFIMQDLGMSMRVKHLLPEARIHASTQLTVHNTEGARLMKRLGFERVVVARELSGEEISDITRNGGVETEMFVHGALCMSYSGQCLMSSLIGGRSGNRGSCAQPCRLPYELFSQDNSLGKGYYLSPRDLSLTENITDIFSLNVSSLKIEGRMKGQEYVAAAVSVLRRLIDEERNANNEEKLLLKNAFSRDGFTSGAFAGDFKRYINFASGNDEIYKNRDLSLLKSLKIFTEEGANLKKLPVKFSTLVKQGEEIKITAAFDKFKTEAFGNIAQKAQNKPTDKAAIEKQISKTGDYPFYAESIEVDTDNNSFLPVSEINSCRRKALDLLTEEIISSYRHNEAIALSQTKTKKKEQGELSLAVMVLNKEQLEAAEGSGVERIFAPCEIAKENHIAVFPDIIHNKYLPKYIEILENTKCDTICTANYAIIEKASVLDKKIISTPALNVFNNDSARLWQDRGVSEIILSHELNLKQIAEFDIPVGVIAYGRADMMKTLVCPVKSAKGKCMGQSCKAYLKDRKNEEFPVLCNGMTTFVLNSKPIYMADKLSDLEKAGVEFALIRFTIERGEECNKIISAYKKGLEPFVDFTRGHFYRGVI